MRPKLFPFALLLIGCLVLSVAAVIQKDNVPTTDPVPAKATTATPEASSTPSEPTPPRHIILAMTDDQGYGQAGYLGHPDLKTPALDQMAQDGTILNQFYVQAPICSPTRVSILTAQHPYRQNCLTVPGCNIDPDQTSIADILNQADYSTAHYGKWHIGPLESRGRNPVISPVELGFDHSFTSSLPFDMGEVDFLVDGQMKTITVTEDTSTFLAKKAIKHLEESVASNTNSFTVIWYPSPHSPYVSEAQYANGSSDYEQMLGELRGVDASIKLLRDTIKDLDIYDETLLVFNSDNGAQSGGRANIDPVANGGLRGGKNSLYQGGIRVPAIVEYPGGNLSTEAVDMPISSTDLMPTILEMVNLEAPSTIDGVSRVAELRGGTSGEDLFFWYDKDLTDLADADQSTAASIAWPYKVIETPAAREVYNLETDPNETTNLYDESFSNYFDDLEIRKNATLPANNQ